jgi:hypothetical protein
VRLSYQETLMTRQRDFKSHVRARQLETGEKYTVARLAVLAQQSGDVAKSCVDVSPLPELFKNSEAAPIAHFELKENSEQVAPLEAIVLSCSDNAIRLCLLGGNELVTMKTSQFHSWHAIPGKIIKIQQSKRWTFKRHEYISGEILSSHIDLGAIGIKPLSLEDRGATNFEKVYEPFTRADQHYEFWKKSVATPRNTYEFEDVAWGIVCPEDPDAPENFLTCEAADAVDSSDAREMLMEALSIDIRCIDAHAHLGNLMFKMFPNTALEHYRVGVAIGELSLPKNFSGALPWGHLNNRPYLRALHGMGLCLWRLNKTAEALAVFERILWLNPPDNQGVRACWADVRDGEPWVDDEEDFYD